MGTGTPPTIPPGTAAHRSSRTKLIDPQLSRKGTILDTGIAHINNLSVSNEMVLFHMTLSLFAHEYV